MSRAYDGVDPQGPVDDALYRTWLGHHVHPVLCAAADADRLTDDG